MTYANRAISVLSVCLLLAMTGCASVPEEAVTLSKTVGHDIQQLQSGYRETIRLAFDQMRQDGLHVIDNVWTPAFVEDYIQRGKLIESAQDEELGTYLVVNWARKAIEKIDAKKKDFLNPLQVQEDALLADVDAAFDQVISANAAVTAHLSSVVKVKNQQTQVLGKDLSGLRDKINKSLVSASGFAAKATQSIIDSVREPAVELQ